MVRSHVIMDELIISRRKVLIRGNVLLSSLVGFGSRKHVAPLEILVQIGCSRFICVKLLLVTS